MSSFFQLERHLKFIAITVLTVLALLFSGLIINKLVQSQQIFNQLTENALNEKQLAGWENDTIRNLYKDKWWYEQQLAIAKSDSINLGINLYDSIIQVQLKGTVLFQAKILKHSPKQFFGNSDEKLYQMLFKESSRIDSCYANIPKKPIKKIVAPKVGTEVQPHKADSLKENQLVWHFVTNQAIKVSIYGVQENGDSTQKKIDAILPIHRISESLNNPLKPPKTIPLFLWITDQDAKAIYRALPDNAQVIFRD